MIETSMHILVPQTLYKRFVLALLLLYTIQLPMQTVAIQMSFVLCFKMASSL